MACTALSKGRGLDCSRTSGGIKYVYFAVYDQVTSIPQTAGEVTDIEMGTDVLYRYAMPLGTASLSESITGSRENGTIFYTPTLNLVLNKLTKEELVDLALKLDLDMSRKGIDTYFIVLEKLELIMGVDKFEVFQDKYLC